MDFKFGSISKQGLCPDNQDCEGYFTHKDRGFSCFVVADGLGAHKEGMIASKLAVNSIINHLKQSKTDDLSSELSNALLYANECIKKSKKRQNDMRTTCVAFVVNNYIGFGAHTGDSRIYVFRNGKVYHRTLDHSVIQMLLNLQEINENEVATHPDRNRLTKVLGMEGQVNPTCFSVNLESGDQILLCTDGFWTNFKDAELANYLNKYESLSPGEKLEKLYEDLRHKQMIEDNFTAQLIMVL